MKVGGQGRQQQQGLSWGVCGRGLEAQPAPGVHRLGSASGRGGSLSRAAGRGI